MKTKFVRFLSVLLGLAVGSPALRAGETVIPVTAQSLATWAVVGDAPASGATAGALVLPPGTQLARAFATTRLTVSMTTRPVFGAEPAESPVLEVGTTALVFMANGQSGNIAVVVGKCEPILLSSQIPLDEAGRSRESFTVSLAVAEGTMTVTAGGQSRQLSREDQPDGSPEVVISAGRNATWDFERLNVVISVPDFVNTEPALAAGSGTGTGRNGTRGEPRSDTGTLDKVSSSADPASSEENPELDPARLAAPASTLEVFTPPAVRHDRGETARAAAFKARQN